MKPLNCLLTLLLLLAIDNANAEFTKGTTRIYFHPGSQVSAVLFDHVYIDCGAIHGRWQQMIIYLPSSKPFFTGERKMKKGDPLLDSAGKQVGYIASDSIDLSPLGSVAANVFRIRITGYVADSNLDQASVPELQLQELVAKHKDSLVMGVFKDFMAAHHFRKYDEIEQYVPQDDVYDCYFEGYIGGPTMFRLQFVFRGERLVAILHGLPLSCPGFTDTPLLKHHHLLWLGPVGAPEKMELIRSCNKIYSRVVAG
jgi:hypothetical protein